MESATPKEKQSVLKIINEYLNLIILIPIIIGGIWQLIKLSNISMSYVRFFSLTQLASDGILVLLYISIVIFPICLLIFLSIAYIKNSKKDDVKKKPEKNYVSGVYRILLSFGMLLVGWHFINNENYFDIIDCMLVSILTVCCSLVGLIFFFTGLESMGVTEIGETIKSFPTLSVLGYMSLIAALLINFIYRSAISFDENYSVPKNLENIDGLLDSKKEKLIYYNDSYIFIEDIEVKSPGEENKIRVIKFDELFESKTPTK